jgi:hypothetical protein
MKTKTIFLIAPIVSILSILVYFIFIQPLALMAQGLPPGVPIKADGGGGINLAPTPNLPGSADKVILMVTETTGMPINVKVNGVLKSRIDSLFWCEIYCYSKPFPSKFVEVDSAAPNDPNWNSIHAKAFLNSASPSPNPNDLNRRLDNVNNIYTSQFSGLLAEKYFFIDIQNLAPPTEVIINEDIGGPAPNTYRITDRKILFLDVKQNSTINYSLTHRSGPDVLINVYYMQ